MDIYDCLWLYSRGLHIPLWLQAEWTRTFHGWMALSNGPRPHSRTQATGCLQQRLDWGLALWFLCGTTHLVRWPRGVSETWGLKTIFSFLVLTMVCSFGGAALAEARAPFYHSHNDAHCPRVGNSKIFLDYQETSNKLYLWKQHRWENYVQIKKKKAALLLIHTTPLWQ